MSAGDADLRRRVEKLEALVNKGRGFWFALLLVGGLIVLGVSALWDVFTEVLKHWRGVSGS